MRTLHLGSSVTNARQQIDKLVISQLGLLAQRRLARGVKLNHAEATVRSYRLSITAVLTSDTSRL